MGTPLTPKGSTEMYRDVHLTRDVIGTFRVSILGSGIYKLNFRIGELMKGLIVRIQRNQRNQ